jgi:DNA-binding HxlR family transcriptional regulator
VSVDKPFPQIDELIHQRNRLAIVSTLAPVESLGFNELKAHLGLTDGNLSTHLSALEKAGYIAVAKTFKGKKPNTAVSMTRKGRSALAKYVEQLRAILTPEEERRVSSVEYRVSSDE